MSTDGTAERAIGEYRVSELHFLIFGPNFLSGASFDDELFINMKLVDYIRNERLHVRNEQKLRLK